MNTASNQANTTSSVHGSSSISNPEVITNVSSDSITNKTRLKKVQKEQLVDAADSPSDHTSSWKDPLKPENGKDSTSELQVEGNDGKESTNRTTNASASAVSAAASSTKKKKKIPKALVIPFEISSRFGDPSILHSVANITANIKAPEGVAEAISPIKEPRSASISVKVGSIPKTRSKSETRQDPSVEFTFKQISQSRGPESGISRGVLDRQTAQLNPTEAFEVVTEGKAVAEKRTNRSINGKPKSIEAREHRDQTVSENTTNLDRMESEQEKEELHNEEVVTKQKTTQENRNESCTGVPEETYTQRNQATTEVKVAQEFQRRLIPREAEYAELMQESEAIALEDVTPKEVEQRKEQKKKEKKEKPKKEVKPLEQIRPKEEVKHKEVKPKEEVKPQERVGSKQEISKKKKEEKPQEKVESKEEINKKEKKEKPLEEPKPAEETENKEKNLKKDVKPKEGKPRKEVKFKEEKLKDEVKPKQEDNKKKKKEERNKEGVMSQVNKQNETDRASVTEKNDGQQEKMGTISWTEAEANRRDKDGILAVHQDQSENEFRMLGDVTASIDAYQDTANEDVIESIVLKTKKRKNFDKQFEKEYQTSEEEKMEQKEEDRMIIKGGEISMDEEKLESEHTEEYTKAYTVAMPTMKCEPSEEKAEETFIGQLVEKTGKEKNNKRGTKSKLSRSRLKKDSMLEEMAGEPETTDEKMSLTAPIDERSANVPVSGILEENMNIASLQEILPTKINEKMTNENENCEESASKGNFESIKKAKPVEKLEDSSEVELPPQKRFNSSDLCVKEVSRTDGEVLEPNGDSLPQPANLMDEDHTTTKRFDPSSTLRSDGAAEEPGTSQILDVSEKNDSVDPSISGRAATEETVKIVKQLEPKQAYRKGDTVTLMIELDRETYEVEWYKDGEPIQVNEKCSVETNGVSCELTIKNVDSTDSGNYTVVSNGSQSIAKISVSDAPRFTTDEMEGVMKVKKDEHISFNIPFNCLTTPTLCCLKDGLPLQEESANHVLEIRENSVHFFKDKATKQDTDVPNPPGNLTAKIIDSNKISLSWDGPEFGWDDEKIVEYVIEAKEANRRRFREIAKIRAGKTEYILDNLQMGTCYTVRVKAVNVFGSSEPSEITNVKLLSKSIEFFLI
ncbi:fibronectin type III domain protein [Necator americanus]|uniref:Fibronectin type III domain protein n=1 Tax=Necator americanus TaxID=51031 RepID=W2SS33_NECAM|nr:fibronectin type III domain protein [Necator americanus]ETN72293.1 fibronectin type III domain protein [Necator americanus]